MSHYLDSPGIDGVQKYFHFINNNDHEIYHRLEKIALVRLQNQGKGPGLCLFL